MKVNIANHDFPSILDGVYNFALSNYPHITDWELKKLMLFVEYEKKHGRKTQIDCESEDILQIVKKTLSSPELVSLAMLPDKITECTACLHNGCLTRLLCHITDTESAKSILSNGKILSAVKARKRSGAELSEESRNAAGDPPDYFDYIMFSWGNCQAGDRLVMERLLGRFPNEEDVSTGFSPGVRFFFPYDVVASHPKCVFDGHHPVKIKDSIELKENLLACIVPKHFEKEIAGYVPSYLKEEIFFVEHNNEDIWQWAEKTYNFAVSLI